MRALLFQPASLELRKNSEQLRERLQPAGGGANANDGKAIWSPAFRLELVVRFLFRHGRHLGVETLKISRLSIRTLSYRLQNFLTVFRFHGTHQGRAAKPALQPGFAKSPNHPHQVDIE